MITVGVALLVSDAGAGETSVRRGGVRAAVQLRGRTVRLGLEGVTERDFYGDAWRVAGASMKGSPYTVFRHCRLPTACNCRLLACNCRLLTVRVSKSHRPDGCGGQHPEQ